MEYFNHSIQVTVITHESTVEKDEATQPPQSTTYFNYTTIPPQNDTASTYASISGWKDPAFENKTRMYNSTIDEHHFGYADGNVTFRTNVSSAGERNMTSVNSTLGESPLVRFSYEFSLFLFFLILIGVTLNLFFVRFLRSSRVLMTVKGTFWYSISVCNLLLAGGVSILLFLALSRKDWLLRDVGCKTFIASLLCLTAFLNNCMAVLAIERCVFIHRKSKEVNKNPSLKRQSLYIDQSYKKYAVYILLAVCAWSLVLGLPPVFGWSSTHLDPDRLSCQLLEGRHEGSLPSFHLFFICGAIGLPCLVILMVYIKNRHKVKIISAQLQNNRHRSSVVKLAMRVTRASTSSGPRQSISSLSSVIIRDTQNFIRQPLTVEIQMEKRYCKYQAIWGTCCIFASLPFIFISLSSVFRHSLPPESTTIASFVYLCNPVAIPFLIICLHDNLRGDFRKYLTATLCFISDDFVPTAVVAPQAYRSGSRERRESVISGKSAGSTGEDPKQKVERRRSLVTARCNSPAYGGPALTPIIEGPSTSNYSPSPRASPITYGSKLAEALGRKDGMVQAPRVEDLNLQLRNLANEKENPPPVEQLTATVPNQPPGGKQRDQQLPAIGKQRDNQPFSVKQRDNQPLSLKQRDNQPTGGKRKHPLQSSVCCEDIELPKISQ